MDGIELATKKAKINADILNSKKYFFEFDSQSKLITISIRLTQEFSVNDEIVNFQNINDFLIKNNALVDGEFIIIPCYSMSLYINFDEKIFLEVLIYSPSLKNLYEKEYLKQFKDYQDNRLLESSEIIFIPFKSVGVYKFGELEECFLNQTKLSYHDNRGVNGKKYYDCEDIIFRFDQDQLSQICISRPTFKILFDNIDISTIEGVNFLLDNYPAIKSRSHTIFLSIGVAVRNKINSEKDFEIYFFDKILAKYWKNIHRPITSW